jgi:hypothetical protein
MVIQIIPNNERQKVPLSRRFSDAIGVGLEGANKLVKQYEESEALKGQGIDPNLPPEIRKLIMEYQLKGGLQDQKSQSQGLVDLENVENIKKQFGEKFTNLWKAAPIGGKTELLKHAMDTVGRGHDLDELLSRVEEETGITIPSDEMENENIPQMKDNKLPEDVKWPDYSKRPKGYTPKEWTDERKTWRKENSEIFSENAKRLKNRKADVLATKKLDQLNKSRNLDKDFSRYLINPETGDFYGLAKIAGFASPEAQEWGKTIARFQNRAKDAFGSRVTNFDLQSYMQQFPGLLNTEEGRSRIIEMMKTNYELDDLYDSALDKVYKKYKLNGISFEDADELAQQLVKSKTEELENKFLGLESQNMEEFGNQEQQLSGRMIDVIGPDGQEYEIDESELNQLPEGFKRK